MAETGRYLPFFVGNNGREPMWHYLVLVSTTLFGDIPFAVRLVAALAGLLTVPMMYRFAQLLLRPYSPSPTMRRWLALAAAGWLAVSWWHLMLSRVGLRPVLLPPLLMLSLYFFVKGWRGAGGRVVGSKGAASEQAESRAAVGPSAQGRVPNPSSDGLGFASPHLPSFLGNFALAGIFLGLSQYTYLPARLAPLILAGIVILYSFQMRRANVGNSAADGSHVPRPESHVLSPAQLWLGPLITALFAALVFLPLGLFFFKNPDIFSSRTGDVAFLPKTLGDLVLHLFQGLSLFWGAGHELYRHHLPGRAMLGWLEIPFFWLGLIFLLRRTSLRRPESHLILLGLLVMWLPALLASPPVHSLRPIGLLPFFYLIVTLGLFYGSHLAQHVLGTTSRDSRGMSYVLLCAVLILNGLVNSYDYFQRWANQPDVYQEYNGPLVNLVEHLIALTETHDVIIPFHLYVHPTTRYLLQSAFSEVNDPAPRFDRPALMLLIPSSFQLLYVGSIPESPALVLLTRRESGQGVIYVSRPPRSEEGARINTLLSALPAQPFEDRLGRVVAQLVSITNRQAPLANLFSTAPLRTIDLNWANLARLKGYDVTPQLAQPGQPIVLNFYWQSLTDKTFDNRLFLQLIDSAGTPLSQWEGDAFREDMYRWRNDGILPSQHSLWLGPDTPTGTYLVRVGFFEPASGMRLQVWQAGSMEEGDKPIDQVQLGLFYVAPPGSDPRQAKTPLAAAFGDQIELTGITVANEHNSPLTVTFYWHSRRPTGKPYTVFLQLLDEQGLVVSGWDSQPLNGLYPTNLWSPGEIIVDTFRLPLPDQGLVPGTYRLITGFYDVDTGQRLPVAGGGDFVELAQFAID